MSKKDKGLTAENAQTILTMIDAFEAPNTKGRHDRKHFRDLVTNSVDLGAFTREALTQQYGLTGQQIRSIFAGAAAPLSTEARKRFIRELRGKASAKLNGTQSAVSQGVKPEARVS